VALGHHLGADQDVGLAVADLLEQGVPLAAGACRVPVDAQHPGGGEAFGEGLFEALGAAAEGLDVLVAAVGAGQRDAGLEAAVVAAQAPVGQVQHHVGGAVRAAADPAAGRAREHRGVAAPVEEDEALLALLQAHLDGPQQVLGEAVLELLAAHVHRAHLGQGGGNGAAGQFDAFVAAGLGGVPAFEGRRGGAQHDGHAALAGAPDGEVAGGVAHALVLLVAGVVFFVDDDQAEPRRREHRQAGAQHDVGAALHGLHEALGAGAFGQRRVQADHPRRRKAPGHAAFELGREGDLGDQDQGLAAAGDDLLHEAQVDLGLAAAGDAEEQEGLEAPEAFREAGDGGLLFVGEGGGAGHLRRVGGAPGRSSRA
jgi:hypothetical protein